MSTTENETNPTRAQSAFSQAAKDYGLAAPDSKEETDALFEMAQAAFDRAEEIRERANASIESANTIIDQVNAMTKTTTERLDAVARESANNQIELGLHAQALDAHGGRLQSFGDAIDAIKGALNGFHEDITRLEADRTVSSVARIATPSIRVRIAHTNTLKDGWRCSETTVEYDGPMDQYDGDVMAGYLMGAHHLGLREANLRNAPQPPEIDGGELDE